MIREHLFDKRAPADPHFRWRGGAVSRLEGFSDGVFAVTLTLLVVTTEVPGAFYEMWLLLRDLPVFLASFALLMLAWSTHHQFFRRYGLEDNVTVFLNGAFLFLVLFFAYPLKFLAEFLWRLVLREETASMFVVPDGVPDPWGWLESNLSQRSAMMYFYSFGLIGVFGILFLMLLRAYGKRDVLELDELECHLTRVSLRQQAIMLLVGTASVAVLYTTQNPGLSGVIYFLIGPLQAVIGILGGIRTAIILRSQEEPTS